MAEDLPSREILKQIVERLDVLDRVLGTNTARLHKIEQHVGIVPPTQSWKDPLPGQNGETQPATRKVETHPAASQVETPSAMPQVESQATMSQVEAQDLNGSDATQPGPIAAELLEPLEQKWSQPETPPPNTPAAHSWINESFPARNFASIEDALQADRQAHVENAVTAKDAVLPEAEVVAKRRDLESVIGGSWFNWIGIIAVIFGVGFFLKFAFDKQWVGPSARVSLAALLGVALLYVGERLRRRDLGSYAYVISGGGLLILYLSDFAAYSLYHLIGHTPALVLMAAVTTTAVFLSVRLNALPVAILGLVGGFLTPVLLSTGVDNEVGLFTYVALLDAGVLAVAYFKRWRSLDFLSFAGTVAITLGWAFKFFSPDKLWTTIFFLSVFFLLYSLLPIFHNVLRGRPSRWFDVLLALANATFYFGISYLMLTDTGFDQATPATQSLLLSIFFTGLFYTTWRWSADDRLLRYNYIEVAATFLAVALSMQLDLHWVTIGWAVEALMLTWVGLRLSETAARHAALAVFCAALVHWFAWDMPGFGYSVDPSFIPILNRRALSCAVLVGAIAGAARLYKRAAELDEDERSTAKTFLLLTGNAVALTLLSVDLNDYFTARLSHSGTEQASLLEQLESARQFSISVLWTLYAATMLALGLLRRSKLLRWGGLLLLLTAIIKVVVLDSTYYAVSWHWPVFNHTFIAYALLVAVLAFGAWLYGRPASADDSERRAMRLALMFAANLLALGALSLEVFGYYERQLTSATFEVQSTEIFRQLQEGRAFTLVLVWTLYATCAFLVGARHRSAAWRWGGLLLLAVTILLAFANLSYYNAAWHALVLNRTLASLAILIAALCLMVWAYARSVEAFEEAQRVRPIATVAANLLALGALSLEVFGYYERLLTSATFEGQSTEILRQLQEGRTFTLLLVWTLYATCAFLFGAWRRSPAWRWGGLLLLAVTVPLAFAHLSYYDAAWHALVFNRTLASFALLIAALWLIVRIYARSAEAFEEAPRVRPIATVAANLLAIVALSAQAAGYYEAKIVEELSHAAAATPGFNGFEGQRNLELAKQLSLSVVWALYAVGLLVAGRVHRLLRVMGLLLLSLTTLKVFLVDLSSLERAYRIISFIMLGAILLVVSYFYQRRQQSAAAKES